MGQGKCRPLTRVQPHERLVLAAGAVVAGGASQLTESMVCPVIQRVGDIIGIQFEIAFGTAFSLQSLTQ